MSGLAKGDIPMRGSLSPGSRFQSLSISALEKGDRHPRERVRTLPFTLPLVLQLFITETSSLMVRVLSYCAEDQRLQTP